MKPQAAKTRALSTATEPWASRQCCTTGWVLRGLRLHETLDETLPCRCIPIGGATATEERLKHLDCLRS
jgi:hypothetical protein